jgi:hypothetical protein
MTRLYTFLYTSSVIFGLCRSEKSASPATRFQPLTAMLGDSTDDTAVCAGPGGAGSQTEFIPCVVQPLLARSDQKHIEADGDDVPEPSWGSAWDIVGRCSSSPQSSPCSSWWSGHGCRWPQLQLLVLDAL